MTASLPVPDHRDRFFSDGEWVLPQGRGRMPVVKPATEDLLCEIPLGDAQDVELLLQNSDR